MAKKTRAKSVVKTVKLWSKEPPKECEVCGGRLYAPEAPKDKENFPHKFIFGPHVRGKSLVMCPPCHQQFGSKREGAKFTTYQRRSDGVWTEVKNG